MIFEYVYWHYFVAPGEIVKIARNYLAGVWHLFLIRRHAKTLFAPWHRMQLTTEGGGGVLDKIGSGIADTYFRFVAGIVRMCIIVAGLCATLVVVCLFAGLSALWLVWPLVLFITVTNALPAVSGF